MRAAWEGAARSPADGMPRAAWVCMFRITVAKPVMLPVLFLSLLQAVRPNLCQPSAEVADAPAYLVPAWRPALAADAALGGSEYAHVVLDIAAPAEVSFVPRAVQQHFGAQVWRAGGAGAATLGRAAVLRDAGRCVARAACSRCSRP